MNVGLKALVDAIFGVEKIAMDAVQKNYISLAADGMALLMSVPGDISGFSDLTNELKSLQIAANQTDLVSYIQKKLGGVPELSSDKAQAIILALTHFIQAAIELEAVFVPSK